MVRYIKIGGATRPITFNINALIEFEDLTGIDITETEGRERMSRLKNIRALAFCGLKHGFKEETKDAPDFSIDDVGAWLDTDNISEVTAAFLKENPPGKEGEEVAGDKKKLDGGTSGL